MPRATPLQPEERRRRLLSSARLVFADQGYHAASVDDVIRAAGVARGTFYNYFPSKRAVFQTLLEDFFSTIMDGVRPIRRAPVAAIPEQIELLLASLCGLMESNREGARLLFSEAVGLDSEADAALAAFYARARLRIATALREGQAMGVVGGGDPDVLAVCLLGMFKEYWYQDILGAPPATVQAFTAQVFALLARGILGEP